MHHQTLQTPHSLLAMSQWTLEQTHNCMVTLHLRQSKTDPFGVGCFIYLGRTNTNPCPVAAVLNYLSVRPSTPGPLFVFANGSPLTRADMYRCEVCRINLTEKTTSCQLCLDSFIDSAWFVEAGRVHCKNGCVIMTPFVCVKCLCENDTQFWCQKADTNKCVIATLSVVS